MRELFGDDVERVLVEAYERARTILGEHRQSISAVVAALLREQEFSGEELSRILKQVADAAT